MNDGIAFIGAGRMAEAIISGFIASGMSGGNITIYDANASRMEYMRDTYGVDLASSGASAADGAGIVVLAVKPDTVARALGEAGTALESKVLLSIAAGWTVRQLRLKAPGARVARVMPNTPALAGKGVFVMSGEHDLTDEEFTRILGLFSGMGLVEILDDKHMDAATALSGCGPAYVFMFIEALADAAVREGLPRDAALRMAAATVNGGAAMVGRGEHPAQLKDAVMSPGGATAEAIYALEKGCFRGAVMDAVRAATLKSKSLQGDNA